MMNSGTRSLQELVQRMMEVNTRLGGQNNPSQQGPDNPALEEDPVESGGIQPSSEQPVPLKTLMLQPEEPEKTHPFLEFNQGNLIRGIVFAEILGKPKAIRGRSRF